MSERTERLPRRRLKWALVVLGAMLLVAYVAIEAIGREVIESVAEDQIHAYGVAGEVDVDVGRAWWTPSITRLLVTNRLDRAEVELRSAQLFMVPVHKARYRLDDMDVSFSVRERTVAVSSLGSGSVLVVIDPASVSVFLGARVTARSGSLYVGDSAEPVSVEVEGSELVINSPVLEAVNGSSRAAFPVVDSYLLPCEPTAKVRGRFIELKCTGSELPGILGQAIGVGQEPADVGDQDVPAYIEPPQSTELDPGATSIAPGAPTTVPGATSIAPGAPTTVPGAPTTTGG